MSIIHIETIPIGKGQFEFIQTWLDRDTCIDERTFVESHDDRMIAAITNVGKACRWFFDNKTGRGTIVIVSDQDGKDYRYGGEHNDLFEAIHSQSDYQKNRLKYSIIYGKHVAYLDRIRELANNQEICFSLNADTLQEINVKGAEFVQREPIPLHGKSEYWTRENLVKLSLKGAHNIVTCVACRKSIRYNQTDNFRPFTVDNGRGKFNKLIKSNKQLVKYFLDTHVSLHVK